MTSFDELRSFLSEHVQGQSKERALRLLDAVRQEERRKGEESLGGAGPFGRPNGESAAHAAFVGDALPGGNGVLGGWPSVPSVGAGAWGKPSLDGMGAGVAGGAWGGPGGFSAAGAWSFGASGAPIDSDEAAVLAGLALDGAPPGLGGSGITWNSNPVASFDLVDPAADTSRFAGAFMMPKAGEASAGDASGGENTSGGGQGGPSGGMSAGSAVGGSGVGPGAPKGNSGIPAPQQTPGQPQPAVKFSSVVGGQAAPPRSVPAPGGDSSAGGNIPGVPMPQSAPGQPQTAVKFSSVVGGQAAPPRPAPAPMTDGDKRDSKRQDGKAGPGGKIVGQGSMSGGAGSGASGGTVGKASEPKRIDAAAMGGAKAAATTAAKVKLRGLPYGANINDVLNFFRGFGITEQHVTFGVNSDGRPSGEAWVSFARLEDARRAVREKDRHHMGDRYVELFLLNEGGSVAARRS